MAFRRWNNTVLKNKAVTYSRSMTCNLDLLPKRKDLSQKVRTFAILRTRHNNFACLVTNVRSYTSVASVSRLDPTVYLLGRFH